MATIGTAVGVSQSIPITTQTPLVNEFYARALMASLNSAVLARTHIIQSKVLFSEFTAPGTIEHLGNPLMVDAMAVRDAVSHRVAHVHEGLGIIKKLALYTENTCDHIIVRPSLGAPEKSWIYRIDFDRQDVTAAKVVIGRLHQRGFDIHEFAKFRNEVAHEAHFPDFQLLWNETMLPNGKIQLAHVALEGEVRDAAYGAVLGTRYPPFSGYRLNHPQLPNAITRHAHDAQVVSARRQAGLAPSVPPQNNDDLLP